jgi:hypothetical protein
MYPARSWGIKDGQVPPVTFSRTAYNNHPLTLQRPIIVLLYPTFSMSLYRYPNGLSAAAVLSRH